MPPTIGSALREPVGSGRHADAQEGRLPDEEVVAMLVAQAAAGDELAWGRLVERYAPLVWSICRRYQLGRPDIDDVAQGVWLLLLESLPTLRVPAALPGWLVTTTRRECLRVARRTRGRESTEVVLPAELPVDDHTEAVEEELLRAERRTALRAAFSELAQRCQRLLTMLLLDDPPATYAVISAELDMPIGSIGPNRSRCLEALRRTTAMAAWFATNGAGEAQVRHA
jgi:RNA polymerase sigma factor (sigma-70 family)